MLAKDRFYKAVKKGLEKEQWVITHDPLRISFTEEDEVRGDLLAERMLVAAKMGEKIAVQVKSFLSDSAFFDFHVALGQYFNYRLILELNEKEHTLYLGVPIAAYESFFQRDLPKASVKKYQVKLIVYDPVDEVIVKWKN
ncbi:fatty-acid oxidation protein subunit alpha [Scytonema tolypothrichoides VB-61278]|nr:fatty-acid oxidation protein subunit alpha [Scytonema tolypothrichoides VB-61278]